MGYIYTKSGKLVCDICGAAGARKYRCPFGSCPATAACPKCRKEHTAKFGKIAHREYGCEKFAAEFKAREELQQRLLDEGKAVRCSALTSGPGRVHVLFQTSDGTVGFEMDADTYHAIDLIAPATPEDYEKFGTLIPAEPTFDFGRTSKQVAL